MSAPKRADDFEVAIIGAGAAGAALGAVLARQGCKTALIDPREPHDRDFRAEKLTAAQWAQVGRLGLQADCRTVMTPEPVVWVARRGRLIEKRASGNLNFRYPSLVAALRRAAMAESALEFVPQRVCELAVAEDRQQIRLGDGRVLFARLAVISTGVGGFLPKSLDFRRKLVFAGHSVSVGFDLAPAGRQKFDFPALTYFGEKPSDALAYLSLFPIDEAMRGNLFVYRPASDPLLDALQRTPDAALSQLLPGLSRIIGLSAVQDAVSLRPVDLYRMENVRRPGIVLVGDAFGTACPASGSGLDKVFSDIVRLNSHLPSWLASPGMAADKIAAFYADPQKIAADASSLSRSRALRDMSTQPGLHWRLRRDLRFITQTARGKLRALLPVPAAQMADGAGLF